MIVIRNQNVSSIQMHPQFEQAYILDPPFGSLMK
jgi:hypothetical protein